MQNEIEFELGELGKLRGKVTPKALHDVESRIGGVAAIARRLTTGETGYGDCVVILHRFCQESMEDPPKLAEVENAIVEVGVFEAIRIARLFISRAATGTHGDDEGGGD